MLKVCHLFLSWRSTMIHHAMYSFKAMSLLLTHPMLLSAQVWLTKNGFVFHRSLTRNIIPPGTASLGETLAAMWLMRPSISFTSTWVRWPFCCSSLAEECIFSTSVDHTHSTDWIDKGTYHSLARGRCLFLCCFLPCYVFEGKKKIRGHVEERKHLYLFLSCYPRHVIF